MPETETGPPTGERKLILHIEVPGIFANDLVESASLWSETGEPKPEDYLNVVTEEWMRPDVGLTIVTIPGEKCTNDDFEVHAYNGRIVGAALTEATSRDGER